MRTPAQHLTVFLSLNTPGMYMRKQEAERRFEMRLLAVGGAIQRQGLAVIKRLVGRSRRTEST